MIDKNVSTTDRVVRILLAALLVVVAAFAPLPAGAQIALYALAGIALITGGVGFCPLYRLFGYSTCPAPKAHA